MRIRPATPDDALPLARLHVAAWRAAYRGLVPDAFLDDLDADARAAHFRSWPAAGEAENHVAEEDGELRGWPTADGCCDSDVDPQTTGEIWGIYSAPGHWRQDLGRMLCRYGDGAAARSCDPAAAWSPPYGFLAGTRGRGAFTRPWAFSPMVPKSLDFGVPLEAVRCRKTLGADLIRSGGSPGPA